MATSPSYPVDQNNPLLVGFSTLDGLEARCKSFRIINQSALKRRYLLSREDIVNTSTGEPVVRKGDELDLTTIKQLRAFLPGNHPVKIYQPDEGIVIVSDMTDSSGITFTVELVNHIVSMGNGRYEGFVDRVDSFSEFLRLLKKALFPKLILIGFLPQDRLESERINFVRCKRYDQYIRAIEITHDEYKHNMYFPKVKQVQIDSMNPRSWNRFMHEVTREYTKPYFVEEF